MKELSDHHLRIDNLIQEIERTRMDLNTIVKEKGENLLDNDVLYVSQKLDRLIVDYLALMQCKQGGDR